MCVSLYGNRNIVCCIAPRKRQVPAHVSNGYVQAMSKLIAKMKVAVDKANHVCVMKDGQFVSDDCCDAWNELDRLTECYLAMSKQLSMSAKKQSTSSEWDVIQ
jgi:hypothetical protein